MSDFPQTSEGSSREQERWRLKACLKLIDSLSASLSRRPPTAKAPGAASRAVAARLLRAVCIEVENTLPKLRAYQEELEALGDEEGSRLLGKAVENLEDGPLEDALAWLRAADYPPAPKDNPDTDA